MWNAVYDSRLRKVISHTHPEASGGGFDMSALGDIPSSSGNWDSAFDTLGSSSGLWNDTRSAVAGSSGNWDSAYDTVASSSGTWGNASTIWETITGTSNLAVNGREYIFNSADGAVTLTLPEPAPDITIHFIAKDISNTCTIARHGSEEIDGNAGDLILDTLRGANALASDGTDWFLVYK